MSEEFEWQKLRVHRDSRYEDLVEKLCSTKSRTEQYYVFSTIKELMVFAALVGFELDSFIPLESKNNTISISLDTYSTTKHDAYIYLLALAKEKNLDVLKDEQLKNAIMIFEGYCNAGLSYINNWILNDISEKFLENIFFNKALEYLSENEE